MVGVVLPPLVEPPVVPPVVVVVVLLPLVVDCVALVDRHGCQTKSPIAKSTTTMTAMRIGVELFAEVEESRSTMSACPFA